MKFKVLAFILIAFSINLYADEYKFDYAVIDNEKVTTVSASNITAHLISESKATVTYKNETVTLQRHPSAAAWSCPACRRRRGSRPDLRRSSSSLRLPAAG